MNLNCSLVKITSVVIQCLRERGKTSLGDLLSFLKATNEDVNEQDVMLAVSFLYLLGRVNYLSDDDVVALAENVND